MADTDISDLIDSWTLHLRAERKSPATVKVYTDGVRAYLRWADANGVPAELERDPVRTFVADLLDRGAEPATARSRQLALKRLSAWAYDEGETDADRLAGLKPPKLDAKVIEPLTDDQLRALLAACAGREFTQRRDTAILRLMLETGARAGEVVAMNVDDVDLKAQVALIRSGKGGRGRLVPFGAKTGQAIDRYLRVRRTHRLADTATLWLGDRGKGLSYDGLHYALAKRATAAGIDGFHPHRMRNTAAHRWLAAGGSEQGLMAVAGWTRPDMLLRYTQARASDRAAAEARRLNLGDI